MNWYAKKDFGEQWSIIDKDTGLTIAITYNELDANLFVSWQEILPALEDIVRLHNLGIFRAAENVNLEGSDWQARLQFAREVIAKARGKA
jgi:hypothetical protein